MTRRTRLDRLRAAVAAVAEATASPVKEVWLPAKDGGGEVPDRYPQPGGRVVIMIYDTADPAPAEGPS